MTAQVATWELFINKSTWEAFFVEQEDKLTKQKYISSHSECPNTASGFIRTVILEMVNFVIESMVALMVRQAMCPAETTSFIILIKTKRSYHILLFRFFAKSSSVCSDIRVLFMFMPGFLSCHYSRLLKCYYCVSLLGSNYYFMPMKCKFSFIYSSFPLSFWSKCEIYLTQIRLFTTD